MARKRYHSGMLRHSIDVLSLDPVRDPDTGEESPRWKAKHTGVRAYVEAVGEAEQQGPDGTITRTQYLFATRGHLFVTAKQRIEWRGRTFNINGSTTDPQDLWTEITAFEELTE